MAMEIVNTSGASKGATGTVLTSPLPDNWQPGDMSYIMFTNYGSGGAATVAIPDGWEVVDERMTGSTIRHLLVRKRLQRGDTNPTFTMNLARTAVAANIVLRSAKLHLMEAMADGLSGYTIPSATPTVNDTLHLGIISAGGANPSFTPPTGWTEVLDRNSGSGVSIGFMTQTIAGGAGVATGTASGSATAITSRNTYRLVFSEIPPFRVWGLPAF